MHRRLQPRRAAPHHTHPLTTLLAAHRRSPFLQQVEKVLKQAAREAWDPSALEARLTDMEMLPEHVSSPLR